MENQYLKVMVSLFLLLIAYLTSSALAATCIQGKQYFSTKLGACVNCSECAPQHAVLRPCEVHRDTHCGPIGQLFKIAESSQHPSQHPHRHGHEERRMKEKEEPPINWMYGEEVLKLSTEESEETEVSSTEAPFSSAEALVWDWQAIALTSAVFACILFFLVITLYSLHQAKQWRRLKDNFDADVEELSARLSLMASVTNSPTSEKGELLESHLTMSPMDGNYLNNRCVYLEQLLNVRKDIKMIGGPENGGNVYIQDSSTSNATKT